MEEPLLGPKRMSSFYFSPALFQIPEEEPAEHHPAPILTECSSSIKERLIFGSPDVSPGSRFIWIDYARSPDGRDRDSREQLLGRALQTPNCNCCNGNSGDLDLLGNRETEASPCDYGLDDLFRDEKQSWAESPRFKLGSRAIEDSKMGGIRRELDGISSRGGQKEENGEAENQSFVINSPGATVLKKPDSLGCRKKQLHRSRTAPAMAVMNEKPDHVVDLKRPPLESRTSVVSQAFIGLVVYLAIGVGIYVWRRRDFSGSSTHGFVDALYFCIVTMCTIGYGDITPLTPTAKLFSCAFVLVGFGFIDILLSGMVSYVLDRQETLLLSAMTAGHHERNYLVDIKKGRMRIRMKVALAFGVVIICIGVGTFVMCFLEDLQWLDAFYLSCMSVTTVGYGDHAFQTLEGRLFASIWLLVSTLAVARSFLYLAEARIDKRHRLIAKWVLQREMTVGDLVAADLDNDGCVSKSDFVVYKLKEMGKVEEKDILEICRQFSRLDMDNSGKITLSYLINLHETSASQK